MSDNLYKFQAPPVVTTNNRVNTSRRAPANTKGRASFRFVNVVLPGQTLPVPCDGTMFYLLTATASLDIRPSGGVFGSYQTGEGQNFDLDNAFTMLEIRNNNSFSVVFDLFVGFQGFIDNKLILANNLYSSVAYPTYPTPNSAATVAINDLSGQPFTDINGGQWYALNRIAIVISNLDTGITFNVQASGSLVANGPAIIAVFPLTSIRLDVSGDYSLNVGGGNVNAVVSELYNAVRRI